MHPKIVQALKDVKAGKAVKVELPELKTMVYKTGKMIRVDFKEQF